MDSLNGKMLLEEMSTDIREIRNRLDTLVTSTEHRLTKVEQRASFFGALGGFLAGSLAWLFGPRQLGN